MTNQSKTLEQIIKDISLVNQSNQPTNQSVVQSTNGAELFKSKLANVSSKLEQAQQRNADRVRQASERLYPDGLYGTDDVLVDTTQPTDLPPIQLKNTSVLDDLGTSVQLGAVNLGRAITDSAYSFYTGAGETFDDRVGNGTKFINPTTDATSLARDVRDLIKAGLSETDGAFIDELDRVVRRNNPIMNILPMSKEEQEKARKEFEERQAVKKQEYEKLINNPDGVYASLTNTGNELYKEYSDKYIASALDRAKKAEQINKNQQGFITDTAKHLWNTVSHYSSAVDAAQSVPIIAGATVVGVATGGTTVPILVSAVGEALLSGQDVKDYARSQGLDVNSQEVQDAIAMAQAGSALLTVAGGAIAGKFGTATLNAPTTFGKASVGKSAIGAVLDNVEEIGIELNNAEALKRLGQDYSTSQVIGETIGSTAIQSGVMTGAGQAVQQLGNAVGLAGNLRDKAKDNLTPDVDTLINRTSDNKHYNPLKAWEVTEKKIASTDMASAEYSDLVNQREKVFKHNQDNIAELTAKIENADTPEKKEKYTQQKELYMTTYGNELLTRENTYRENQSKQITEQFNTTHNFVNNLQESINKNLVIGEKDQQALDTIIASNAQFIKNNNIQLPTRQDNTSASGLNQETKTGTVKYDGNFSIDNTQKTKDDMALGVYTAFRRAGFTDGQARYLVGEVNRENSFNVDTMFGHHSDLNKGKRNFGIISWNGDRLNGVKQALKQAGIPVNDKGTIPSQKALDVMAKYLYQEAERGNYTFKYGKGSGFHTTEFLKNPNPSINEARYGHGLIGWAYGQNTVDGKAFNWEAHNQRRLDGINKINSLLGGYSPTVASIADHIDTSDIYNDGGDTRQTLRRKIDTLQEQIEALQQAQDKQATDTTQTNEQAVESNTEASSTDESVIDTSVDEAIQTKRDTEQFNSLALRFSKISVDEIQQAHTELDNLEQSGYNPQQIVVLRSLLNAKEKSFGQNINEVRSHVTDGLKGSNKRASNLGLNDYFNTFSKALEGDKSALSGLGTKINHLQRFVDNHNQKADALDEALATSTNTGKTIRVANVKDIGWTVIPDDNTQLQGDTQGNVIKVNPSTTKLVEAVRAEANALKDFWNNWQPIVRGLHTKGTLDVSHLMPPKPIETKPVKQEAIVNTPNVNTPKAVVQDRVVRDNVVVQDTVQDNKAQKINQPNQPNKPQGVVNIQSYGYKQAPNSNQVDLTNAMGKGISYDDNNFTFNNNYRLPDGKNDDHFTVKKTKKEIIEAYDNELKNKLINSDTALTSLVGLRGKTLAVNKDNARYLGETSAKVLAHYINMPKQLADEVTQGEYVKAREWIKAQQIQVNDDGSFSFTQVEPENKVTEADEQQADIDTFLSSLNQEKAHQTNQTNQTNEVDLADLTDADLSDKNTDDINLENLGFEVPDEPEQVTIDNIKRHDGEREAVITPERIIRNNISGIKPDSLKYLQESYQTTDENQLIERILKGETTDKQLDKYFKDLLNTYMARGRTRSVTVSKSKHRKRSLDPIKPLGKKSNAQADYDYTPNQSDKYETGSHKLADWLSDMSDTLKLPEYQLITQKLVSLYPTLSVSFDGSKADIQAKNVPDMVAKLVVKSTEHVYDMLGEVVDGELSQFDKQINSLILSLGFIRNSISEVLKSPQAKDFKKELVVTLQEIVNSPDPRLLFTKALNNKSVRDLLISKQVKEGKVKGNLFSRFIHGIVSFLGFKGDKVSNLYEKTLQVAGDMAELQYKEFFKPETGLNVLRGVDAKHERTKPFKERNHFVAYITQTNKPLVKVQNLLNELNVSQGRLLKTLGLNKPNQAQAEQLEHFTTFYNQFEKHIKETFHKANKGYEFSDLKSYLIDEQGNFDENLLTAIAFTAYNYVISDGKTNNTNYDIARLLGVPADEAHDKFLHPKTVKRYKHIGQSYTTISNKLGKDVTSLLGFELHDEAPNDMLSKLQSSIGAWVVSAMQSADMVHMQKVLLSQFEEDKKLIEGTLDTHTTEPNEKGKIDKHLTFVNVVTDKGNGLNPLIEEIKILNKGTQGYLSKIFDSSRGLVYPTLTQPTKVKTKIKKTKAIVSDKQKAIIEQAQQEAYVINNDMVNAMKALSSLDNSLFEQMIGALVPNEVLLKKQVTNHGNLTSRAEGVKRDLDRAMDWVDTLNQEGVNKFYDTMFVAQNARMHLNSNVFNVQSSKLHRAMADNESFSVTIDKVSANPTWFDDKGNITPIGYFIRAVFENAEGTEGYFETKLKGLYKKGFTVDKVATEHFNDVAWEYLNSKQVQPAVKAMQRVLANQAKKDDVKVIKALVDEWDMQGNSLRALVEVANLFTAIENNTSFTTSLGLGSDGVNNGIAIGTWLLGVMDTAFNNMVGLFSKGDKHQSYFSTRLDKMLDDYYDGLSDYVINTLEQKISKLTAQLETTDNPKARERLLRNLVQLGAITFLNNTLTNRKTLKALLIPFGYGAGFKALTNSAYNQMLADIIKHMENLANSDKTTQDDINELNNALYYITGDKVNLTKDTLLTYEFDYKQLAHMHFIYTNLMQPLFQSAVSEYAPKMLLARTLINNMQSGVSKLYISALDSLTKQVLKEKQERLTTQAKKENPKISQYALDQLLDFEKLTKKELDELVFKKLEKAFPTIKIAYTVGSNDTKSDVVLLSQTNTLDYNSLVDSQNYQNTLKDLALVTSRLGISITQFEDTGVSGHAQIVQSGDSNVSAHAMVLPDGTVNQNVHDANIGAINRQQQMGQAQNKAFFHMLAITHENLNTVETTIKTITELDNLGLLTKQNAKDYISNLAKSDLGKEIIVDKLLDLTPDGDFSLNKLLSNVLDGLVEYAKGQEIKKLDALLNLSTVQQYSTEQGEYKPTKADYDSVEKQKQLVKDFKINTHIDSQLGQLKYIENIHYNNFKRDNDWSVKVQYKDSRGNIDYYKLDDFYDGLTKDNVLDRVEYLFKKFELADNQSYPFSLSGKHDINVLPYVMMTYDRKRPDDYLNHLVELSDKLKFKKDLIGFDDTDFVKQEQISFGERADLAHLNDINVVEIKTKQLNFKDTKQLANEILRQIQHSGGLINNDTGWLLTVGKKDRQKMGDNKQLSHQTSQAIQGIKELVENAVVAETHQDIKHNNERVIAVHRLYVPALIDGQLHRVKLTVKDYVLNDGSERKNLHAIEAVEIENALLGTLPSDIKGTVQPTIGHKVSIVNLLKGVKHDGDDGMFFGSVGLNQEQGTDTINIWSSDKNGFELLSNLAPMKPRSELKEASQEQITNPIYDTLGNKTQTSRVKIIPNLFGLKGVKYATENDMVFSLRVANTHEHFGNPFSSDKNLVKKDKLIETNSTKESVIKYIDWVLSKNTDINPKQHKFIRDRLKSGELKGKSIIYYKELNEPSHATALDYLINQYNWDAEFAQQSSNKKSVQKIILPKSPRVPDAIHAKDQAKSDKANKFIGYGAKESSTNLYRQAWGDKANSGVYTADDKVFVSVNGKRQGRVSIHEQVFISELQKAVNAGATIITDTKAHRERSFNIGEQELAHWLQSMGYTEFADGEWIKSSQDSNTPNLNDLKQLVDSNDTTAQSKLLDWLYQAVDTFNTDIKVEMKDLGGDGKHINNGAYDLNNNTLYINPNWFNKASNEAKQVLVAHELIHALTEHSFYSDKPMIKKAIDDLTTMREQLLIVYENNADSYPKELKTKLDLMFDLDGTSHLGEFVAYGLTDKYLQEWINKNLKPIGKTNTASGFKSFVNSFLKAVHTLLGLKNTEPFTEFVKASSQLMSKYDVVDVKQGRLFSKSDIVADTIRYSKIIDDIKDSQSEQDNDDKVNELSTTEVLKGLNFTGSDEFNTHLDKVIDNIIGNYAHNETNKRKVNHKLGVKTAKAFAVTLGLSDKESAVYEIQKAIVDEWLKTYADTQSVNELYNIRKEFINQFKSAKDLAQLFNSDWDKLDQVSKKQLTSMYTHLTKGDDSLTKLVALVSSSEKFHNFMQTKREKVTKATNSWFDKLMEKIQAIIDWFNNITAGNKSKQYSESIKNITNKLSRIDITSRNKTSGYYDMAWKSIGVIGEGLSKGMYSVAYTGARLVGAKETAKLIDYAREAKGKEVVAVEKLAEAVNTEFMPKKMYGEIRNVLFETLGTGNMRKYAERLTRFTQNTSRTREKIKVAVSNTLQSVFDDKPTKEVKEALGRVIIRTDIQSLLETMNITQAIDMIFNDDKRHAKIVELTSKIQQLDDGQAIINQVKSLSAYMVDQTTNTNLVKNAKGIADGIGRHGKAYDDNVRQMIDILATLQAIEYTNDKFISLVSSYKDTPHKLEAIIKFHKDLVNQDKHEFENNPYNYQKGFASELVDPYRAIKQIAIDDTQAIERAKREGWIEVVEELPQDKNDTTVKSVLFYHPSMPPTRRESGGVDLADSHTKGTSVYSELDPNNDMMGVIKARAKDLKSIGKNKDFNPYDNSGSLVASYGVDGRVVELHYEMHGFNRDNLLNRSHDVFEMLGTMAGNTTFKPMVRENQVNVAKVLIKDYQDNYDNNPALFVLLDPTSSEQRLRDDFNQIPYAMRKALADEFGMGKPIYVRASTYNALFGYKKYTVRDIWDKAYRINQLNERGIEHREKLNSVEWFIYKLFGVKGRTLAGQIEDIVQYIVGEVKDYIVIRSVRVLVGNIIANSLLLMLHGVDPITMVKGYTKAWVQGQRHNKWQNEYLELKAKLTFAKPSEKASIKQQMNLLQQRMDNSSVDMFMKAGMMNTIVEDISTFKEDSGFQSPIEKRIEGVTSKIPTPIKTTFNWLTIAPSTPIHKFLSDATQFSDFGAKLVLAEHLIKKGMKPEQAMSEAQDNFINFDVPTGKGTQYMNDIGLFMFTKFFLRFQRVILKMGRDKPAQTLIQHYAVENYTGMTGVLDPFMLFRLGNNPFHPSALTAVGVADELPIFNLVNGM